MKTNFSEVTGRGLVGNREERMNRMFSFAWNVSVCSQSVHSDLLTRELFLVLQNSAQILLSGTDTARCSQKFMFSSSWSIQLFYISQPPVLVGVAMCLMSTHGI